MYKWFLVADNNLLTYFMHAGTYTSYARNFQMLSIDFVSGICTKTSRCISKVGTLKISYGLVLDLVVKVSLLET